MPTRFHGFNEQGLPSILRSDCHCLHRRYLGVLEKRVGTRETFGFGVADFKAILVVCQVQQMTILVEPSGVSRTCSLC